MLDALAGVEPVIALHGPRSVGKSTVLRTFAAGREVPVIDLDDVAVRDAVRANPTLTVSGKTPLCIDEYQHVPEILDAIKARLNREITDPGTAVLTGSTRQDALPRTAQSLTGRIHRINIWPLSQGELHGSHENLIESLRSDPAATLAAQPQSSTTRSDYVDRIAAGGFPLAVIRQGADRNRWFDNYLRDSILKDASELERIRQRQLVADMLNRLAAQTAQVLNLSNVTDALGVDRKTAEEHLRLLEDLFLVVRLPAWGKTLRARAAAKPKIHVVDSGLAARLLRITPANLGRLDPTVMTEFGHLLETFVVGELRKHVSWMSEPVTTGHWRTHDKDEVDFVVEFDDGDVLAFEVKSGERVNRNDLRGLRKLREALGNRLIAGVAFSTGSRSYTAEDRIHVMPVDRLWRTVDLR
ncbi:ATP-binding protein [Sporichthya sp.]|uniref:ATP-binding protein n=1 Tax=Sporichthya sp. TaxID=65475 RepID=UPI0025E5178E|nr:ATP-binding protein [Sporichthya sp.]